MSSPVEAKHVVSPRIDVRVRITELAALRHDVEGTDAAARALFGAPERVTDLVNQRLCDQLILGDATAVDKVTEFHGKVLARHMKQAQMSGVLTRFVELKGGSWEEAERRLGDKENEILVGDLELPYCTRTTLNGVRHYVLHFNQKAEEPMSREVSTETVEALSDAEIDHMIMQQSLATGGAP